MLQRLLKKLGWVKERRRALDQMELKLRRMRRLARKAQQPDMEPEVRKTIEKEFNRLQEEVKELDEKSKSEKEN